MQRHAHEQIEHTQVGKMTPMNSHTDAPKIPIQMQNACVHTEPCTYMLTHVYTHGIYLTIFINTYTTQMWEDKGTQNRQAHKYKLTHAHRYKWAYEHINAHTCRNTDTCRNTKTQRHVPSCMNIYTEIHTGKFIHFLCNNTHIIIYLRLVCRCTHMHKQMLTPKHTFKNATTTQKTHINIYVYIHISHEKW